MLSKSYLLKALYSFPTPYLYNLNAEYIMRNAGLNEAQAGIKIAGKNINNLRYAESLLMKVREESEKVGLKLNI